MTFELAEALEVLERTPSALDSLLRYSSPSWHTANEGTATWSPFEVVGHLIHADETNWIPRARTILESDSINTFPPFDRFAHLERFPGRSLEDLLDRFAELRQANLRIVRDWDLTDADLSRQGLHPELGTVTLRQLIATWTVHDLAHLGQIVRVMARRYTEVVGPWRTYLSILAR